MMSAVRELFLPDSERTESPLDVVSARPVPVPRKPRTESAQVDAPGSLLRRTLQSTAGVLQLSVLQPCCSIPGVSGYGLVHLW